MILVGSRALMIREPRAIVREPKDFDFVATEREAREWCDTHAARLGAKPVLSSDGRKISVDGTAKVEIELAHAGSCIAAFADFVRSDPNAVPTSLGLVPGIDALFVLKTSHRHLRNSPHFWKTLADWHRMRDLGARVRPEHAEWLKWRERETYTYAHPRLNQSKASFFADDQIEYVYDHDSIHEAVATLDRPAYRFFQKDGEEVASSREKFWACSREVQILSVVEESAVLAIERSLVPHPGALSDERAWKLAFSKVCTSIASGWWRAFAYENAPDALRAYPVNYAATFRAGLERGVVRPFRKAA